MAGKTRLRASQSVEDTIEDKDGDTKVSVEESTDEDKIRFDTAGTQRMIIDEAGQVGVGTDAPEEQFHIHGNNATLRLGNGTNSGEHSPKIQFSESADTSGDMVYGYSVGYNGSTNNFEIKRYADSTTGNIVMTAGRAFGHVGLQTESPEADLHVFAGNSGQTFSNVSGIAVENAGSSDAFFVFQTATAGGGKSFSITNGGKVGIGTTTPDARLHLNTSTTDDVLLLETTEDSSSASPVFKMKRNSSSPADADYLGQIKFAGENDANQEVNYAKITGKIDDASDGTEDGILEFANIKAGSQTITARLRSDSLQLLNSTNLTVDGNVGIGNTSPSQPLDVTGNANVSGNLDVGGTITTTNDISFQDNGGTFPTNTAGFFWDLNNDEARIYAKQPSSDAIDFIFKLSDNNHSQDRYVFWIDDYRGGSYDRYPLVMHGSAIFFQSPESSEGVPDTGNSKARFDSNGRLAFNCQNQTDPSLLLNHAHIYSKLDSGTAEMFVRDSDGNVTKISPHNPEGEWEYFSRNTETGKVVRVNMEKMIRKLEEITGESFMEEWYEDV